MKATNLLTGGLLSVTFRKLTPREIVDLVIQSGLEVIEWGGDIHVPPGNAALASEVAHLTVESGLRVASYGSYYRVGSEQEGEFDRVLESALHLGAPAIRVWAGKVGSEEADAQLRYQIVEDVRLIAEKAQIHGIKVDLEFHGGTLTDTVDSTQRLMEEISSSNVRSYWQQPHNQSVDERVKGLRQILPWVANVHVFHWIERIQQPLMVGMAEWRTYLDVLREAGVPRAVMLEFVRDGDPQQFLQDAQVLKQLLAPSE